MIPNETVERVRDAADAVEIIGEQVKLRRVGTSFRGPCPFHGGKNPNFSVNPKTNAYHCFKCGESGDVFSFVQKRLGLDFVEAVKYVGARAGVDVVEVESRREEKDSREPLWEISAAAAEFFTRALWTEDASAPAREYLATRKLSREVADRFGIGFAPWEGERLRDHLTTLGFTEAQQLEAGLLVRREGENGADAGIRPRFRGRLMFPIHDAQGRTIAFGGRVIGKGEPKYLNSPESPIFTKGRSLYNLHRAKPAARRDERVLVVEGYFDAVRLAASGVEPVVAPLGTALTEGQAEILARLSKTVFLLYDSDQAGLKATFRSADELLRHGASVQVVTLPDGDDPDTYVARHGAEGLERHLASAIDVFERKIQILERGGWFADLRRKRKALDRLIPTIRATSDSLTRDMYLGRASEVSGVSRELLAREAAEEVKPQARGSRGPVSDPRFRDADSPPPRWDGELGSHGPGRQRGTQDRRRQGLSADESSERRLLRALLQHRNFLEGVAERVDTDAIRTLPLRSIYEVLVAAGPDASIEAVAAQLDAEVTRTLDGLMTDAVPEAIAAADIDSALATFAARSIRARIDEIDRMPKAETTGDEYKQLMAEKRTLNAQLNAIGKPSFPTYSTD
ncbi:MAG: DNA primase [Gemmatimonadaceae bacterium]|nr:DNA primase [Gemmatimonadaceae bacterium]